ncbi:hypothetical protein [Bradyrhizobium sp. Rc2d]|uniref:hypothetical protein n=1 Tax=Bradyrhizobium sp. Rc2d TaxID=1855321 RepID=UPI00115F7B1F|nr:hypothetical protein [Bradyrhizobium sp. Rc2d]
MPNSTRLDFCLAVAPANCDDPNFTILADNFGGMFSLQPLRENIQGLITADIAEHFLFVRPAVGHHETQQIRKDEAFIRFHQTIHGQRDLIIYGPNGEGTYLMIFSVPMRSAPVATITPQLPNGTAEIIEATNAWLKYRIRQGNRIVKEPTMIDGILNARM